MLTYLLMGLPFIAAVLILDLFILKTKIILAVQCWYVMAIMLILTAIFNQILTGLPIVTYDQGKILDIHFGNMPAEDFMYAVAATIGLGSLMKHYEK